MGRQRVVDMENKLLCQQLYKVGTRKTAYGNDDWQQRISSIKHNRAFAKNIDRKEKAARLNWENQNMLRRLTGTTSVYNRKEWEKDFQHGRNLIEHSSITYRMNK